MGVSIFAAIAGISTLMLNGKGWMRKMLIKPSLPLGVEQHADGTMWFREVSDFWKGQAFSIQIDRIVYSGKSALQDILIFESERYGTVLTLDGAIQVSTLDEAAYQEVMAHTPMHLHAAGQAKRALVIGGGDGGVLRELAKYAELEEIHICEIDGGVIDAARKYIPSTGVGFDDPRVSVHIEDGFLFLERMIEQGVTFDVIVSDLSDPIGPAESIFNGSFLQLLAKVLNPVTGVAALQGECYWLHSDLIQKLIVEAKASFKNVEYASIAIPTYPCGQIGCLVMSRSATTKASVPVRTGGIDYSQLNYYTKELHEAQFVLPKLAHNMVYGK